MNRLEQTVKDPAPLLRDRIAATPHHAAANQDGSPAVGLIEKLEETERRLAAHLFPAKAAYTLQKIGWSEVAKKVYEPIWRQILRHHVTFLAGVTPDSLPAVMQDLARFSERVRNPPGRLLDQAQEAHTHPGRPAGGIGDAADGGRLGNDRASSGTVFHRDGAEINLTDEFAALEAGRMMAEVWQGLWVGGGWPIFCWRGRVRHIRAGVTWPGRGEEPLGGRTPPHAARRGVRHQSTMDEPSAGESADALAASQEPESRESGAESPAQAWKACPTRH